MSASSPRWIDLLHSALVNNFSAIGHPAKYVQLATCAASANPTAGPSGPSEATTLVVPRVRTVVFRGIVANGQTHWADEWIKIQPNARDALIHLLFVTDMRTRKVQELKENPWTEVCWYFPHTREQFRLSGIGSIVGSSSVSQAHPDIAAVGVDWWRIRESLWAAQSAAAKQTYLDTTTTEDASSSESSGHQVSRHFGLLYVTVNHVDHLDLKSPAVAGQEPTAWTSRQGQYYAVRSAL